MIDLLVTRVAQDVLRGAQFVGLVALLGAVVSRWRLAPVVALHASGSYEQVRRRLIATWRLSLALLAACAVLRLVQQAALFADPPARWPAMTGVVLRETSWGTGWLFQAAGLLLLALASRTDDRRSPTQAGARLDLLAAGGAVALAASPALSGHAVSAPGLAPVLVTLDVAHVAAAGAWLGTLFVLTVAVLPAVRSAPGETRTRLLASFSPVALASAAVLAMTGGVAAWLHLEAPSALWSTRYGQLLLAKLATLVGVAAVGCYNWRVVTPRVAHDAGAAALRRSAVVELTLGAILLAITAVLVATPLPGDLG